MASPRASGFWDRPSSMSRSDSADEYFVDGEDEDVEQQERLLDGEEDEYDGRTPLDKTIDRIGMGSYQWALLSLCGLGWMADNMWIQAVAIILPRVQQHYAGKPVPDSYIGAVSSSMFGGMMIGAVGWGTCSDLMGRITAFNATLFLTAIFGILASLSNSFVTLCISLFFLGSSVGGSMPTDGTLLLEHMPKSKQYLVTALSVFFSFGAVLSAVIALLVIPQNSCKDTTTCNPDSDNLGWKYLLIALALLTLFMFISRMVFFRLHESPRYLVHAGRPHDAIKSLQLISRFNGSNISFELDDVRDTHPPQDSTSPTSTGNTTGLKPDTTRPRASSRTIFDASMIEHGRTPSAGSSRASSIDSGSSGSGSGSSRPPLKTAYAATGETPALDSKSSSLDGKDPVTMAKALYPPPSPSASRGPSTSRPPRSHSRASSTATHRRRTSVYERKLCWSLPRWLRRPLWAWWDRVMMVLSPEWLRTTLLVWAAWWAMSLAYTMFNVFLPKLLETGTSALEVPSTSHSKSLEETLWDVVIFTIGGCPGAIAMWAVLYGWTPEIFGTKVRGSACGIASALSRIGGMIAPILGGILLMIDRSFPVYTSVVVFVVAGFCVLLLRETPRDGGSEKGERVVAH
ncbi:membrane transporter [Coprinopsis cinerea okayama7|uniref:Membrane transporter n=1 Tax=Coprinopsis cinerea (strain Okayama-7 / 130 / ATCC MYA-4618 / FGSC 9003) TaxID=240176 RepID=A8NPY4_COPC7|nr:membrane transporter [Coprinopsis cinerea okayama7\|eukprot:XP_001835433.2 membrane transporter [Coprinopsis cinerea okayama7\